MIPVNICILHYAEKYKLQKKKPPHSMKRLNFEVWALLSTLLSFKKYSLPSFAFTKVLI